MVERFVLLLFWVAFFSYNVLLLPFAVAVLDDKYSTMYLYVSLAVVGDARFSIFVSVFV